MIGLNGKRIRKRRKSDMKKMIRFLCLALVLAMLPLAALADRAYLIDSDSRKLTEAELWEWDRESLSFMFNEIFARHGFTFDAGGKFYNWFNSQPWYQAIAKVSRQEAYNKTTSLEWDNYHTIKKVIADMEAAGHPYRKSGNSKLKSWTDFQPAGSWSLTGFQPITLKSGQSLAVYSAPSVNSWRAANGKASVSTNGSVWAAGWDGSWLQVFYEVNNGGLRVGYVNGSDIKGKVDFKQALYFSYEQEKITADCTLTDDPLRNQTSIATLPAGRAVTYLSTAINQNGKVWDYVETTVNGKTVRGYIPSGCLTVPADILPDLDEYYGGDK